ncbi:MAG: hypothetical protein AAF799_45905 [Myxococcota bacterium]
MLWNDWRNYFARRSTRPRPRIEDTIEIPPRWRPDLARTMARLQLAETGEGRIVADLRRRAEDWQLCPELLESLQSFVAEEGRHAAILGDAVRALGGRPIRRSWAATAFSRTRRLMGPRLELMTLLAAEVGAQAMYGTLVEPLPHGPLRFALEQIAADEAIHLRFHAALFGSVRPLADHRRTLLAVWTALAVAAGVTLALDHGRTLRRLGLRRARVVRRTLESIVAMADSIDTAHRCGHARTRAFESFHGPPPRRFAPTAPPG